MRLWKDILLCRPVPSKYVPGVLITSGAIYKICGYFAAIGFCIAWLLSSLLIEGSSFLTIVGLVLYLLFLLKTRHVALTYDDFFWYLMELVNRLDLSEEEYNHYSESILEDYVKLRDSKKTRIDED